MAERLVDENLNWIPIVSIFLHDIAEDVLITFEENGNEKVLENGAWYDLIHAEFKNTGKADLIIDLIRGVTEKELPDPFSEEGKNIRSRLAKSQLFKMIQGFVAAGRIKGQMRKKEVWGEEREKIYEVVYNFENLMESALASPEHLQILILKITDIWHNFQSPDWIKSSKILRARLAASIAEWFGWYSMRNDLIYSMAYIADTVSPYAPELDQEFTPTYIDKDLTEFIHQSREIIKKLISAFKLNIKNYSIFAGRPIVHTDSNIIRWQDTTLPPPEIIIKTTREFLDQLSMLGGNHTNFRLSIPFANKKSGSTIATCLQQDTITKILSEELGRIRKDFKISIGNNPSFNLRFESDELSIIDGFKIGNTLRTDEIPEARGLFHNNLKDTKYYQQHRSSLIGFLYEPSLITNLGKNLFLIIKNGSIYFFKGDINILQLAQIFNKNGSEIKIYNYRMTETKPSNYHETLSDIAGRNRTRKLLIFRLFYIQ